MLKTIYMEFIEALFGYHSIISTNMIWGDNINHEHVE